MNDRRGRNGSRPMRTRKSAAGAASDLELAEVELAAATARARERDDFDELARIAGDPACPPEILWSLADCSFPLAVWQTALHHPRLPRQRLEQLADAYAIEKEADALLEGLRAPERAVAEERDAAYRELRSRPRQGWRKLSVDERCRLANAPNTPAADLARLAEDSSRSVRHTLAGNAAAPSEVLERLLARQDPAVESQLIDHPNLTQAQLDRIAWLQLGLSDNTTGKRTQGQQQMSRRVLEQNVSADTLALIAARNDDPAVLRLIARHRNTPPRTLVYLADLHRCPTQVWYEAMQHPRTPVTHLEALADDESDGVHTDVREELQRRSLSRR